MTRNLSPGGMAPLECHDHLAEVELPKAKTF